MVCPTRDLFGDELISERGLLLAVERSAIGQEGEIAVAWLRERPSPIGGVDVGTPLAPIHVALDVGVDEPIALAKLRGAFGASSDLAHQAVAPLGSS